MLDKIKEMVAERDLGVDAATITEESSFKEMIWAQIPGLVWVSHGVGRRIWNRDSDGRSGTDCDSRRRYQIHQRSQRIRKKRGLNMQTEVTKLLGIEYPIIQGGMAWVAEHHLAAGVSNAGGLGLSARRAPADWVKRAGS